MTKPKLYYFDAPISRGEECRMAFAVAGVDFDDVRLNREAWTAMKPTSPFGAMPFLELPGKAAFAHSNAILAYIGRTHDLHPTDAFEAARHEGMMEHAEDLRHKVGATLHVSDPAEKKKIREELATTTIPTWAAAAEKNLGDGPFFAGAKLHVVDLKLHMIVRWFASGKVDHIPADVFAPFPKLTRLYHAVGEHPAVMAWRAKHS